MIVDAAPQTVERGSRLAREVVELIEVPFDLGEDRIGISASVGIAFGDSTDDPEALVRDAETAMYVAKTHPDRTAVFGPTMRDRMTPANAERRLEEALERGEFRLFFQPLVALRDARLVGVEALLRWAHPQRGILRPAEFLSALEETGLIVPVGRWVFHEACRQARRWADAAADGSRPLRVSVNVSPRQLSQSDFAEMTREAIEASGIDPALMYLELTETALVSDLRVAWAALGAARRIGVGLALDDFGTGYSSISHLRNFDLELVKLDRSLGIVTLAEGVSDHSHVKRLLELGCELGQGEYFADAQPSAVIDRLIARDAAGVSPGGETREPTRDSGTVVLATRRRARIGPDGDQ